VVLPLVGTGQGGLGARRGLVVSKLVPRLIELARTAAFDVALVLKDRRDFAAVQSARTRAVDAGDPDAGWEALPEHLRKEADRLGIRAARGELSLFLGSGVSAPVGLPSWPDLMTRMAERAEVPYIRRPDSDLRTDAEQLKDKLGEEYDPFMREIFDVNRHALGHALLADLKISQMVTTNYDPCLELALDSIHEEQSYQVLTRNLPLGGRPWLLKLHGDIRRPGSLVLTRSDYEWLDSQGAALYGVVQSLMLTSHLLFVGFSLTDHDFMKLAEEVRTVRSASDEAQAGRLPPSGTALALHPDALDSRVWADQLQIVAMTPDPDVRSAARILELFLDRLSWRSMKDDSLAAEYLLDRRYYEGASGDDTALREALERFENDVSEAARRSSGWSRVEQVLNDLGRSRRWSERNVGDAGDRTSRVVQRETAARAVDRGMSPDPRAWVGQKVATARALAVEIARCPLLTLATEQAKHPCHDVVAVQPVAEPARQVPEAWAGALLTARIVFVSSNPSIAVAQPGSDPLTAEAYPTGAESDDKIAEFLMRRFDPTVKPKPFVMDDKHLQLDGEYHEDKTKFWTSIRARATELLEYPADPSADYVLTEVVHCKSKAQKGVAKASVTCADLYLDRILDLTPATVLVVVGSQAHQRLKGRLDLPQPPYNVLRVVGGRERRVVFLWHPAAFKGPKTFAGLYSDFADLRVAAQGPG